MLNKFKGIASFNYLLYFASPKQNKTILTMRFLEEYTEKSARFDTWKEDVEHKVAELLKYHAKKPIVIGNMVYKTIVKGGKDIPAYCYLSDFDPRSKHQYVFQPIWDKENMGLFGWSNFEECCRIFDVISNRILNNK